MGNDPLIDSELNEEIQFRLGVLSDYEMEKEAALLKLDSLGLDGDPKLVIPLLEHIAVCEEDIANWDVDIIFMLMFQPESPTVDLGEKYRIAISRSRAYRNAAILNTNALVALSELDDTYGSAYKLYWHKLTVYVESYIEAASLNYGLNYVNYARKTLAAPFTDKTYKRVETLLNHAAYNVKLMVRLMRNDLVEKGENRLMLPENYAQQILDAVQKAEPW